MAANFLETLEFHGEFYEVEFYNSKLVFTSLPVVEKCLEKRLGLYVVI